MGQLIFGMTSLAFAMLFLLGAPMLNLIGWTYTEAGAGFVTKIHPSSYLSLIVVMLGVAVGRPDALRTLRQPSVLIYALAAIIMFIKAISITLQGVNEGELSAVVDTFLTPLWIAILIGMLGYGLREKMVLPLRIFFVFNSLMALAERVAGVRFIPSFMDAFTSFDRSAGLLAHPLNAALLTGILIVHLVSSPQKRGAPGIRLAEIGLHAIAMFAFGGRSALVFTVAVLILSAFAPDLRSGAGRASAMNRILPLLVLGAGVCLVFLPIPFIDATLDRFTNDQGSADTRNAAIHLLTMIDTDQLLYGIPAAQRQIFMQFLHTPLGFEISWVMLTVTYGLLITMLMAVALPFFMLGRARGADRSGFYMTLLFLIVTIGSLSIGSKSLLISQTLIMVAILASIPPMDRLQWRFSREEGEPVPDLPDRKMNG